MYRKSLMFRAYAISIALPHDHADLTPMTPCATIQQR